MEAGAPGADQRRRDDAVLADAALHVGREEDVGDQRNDRPVIQLEHGDPSMSMRLSDARALTQLQIGKLGSVRACGLGTPQTVACSKNLLVSVSWAHDACHGRAVRAPRAFGSATAAAASSQAIWIQMNLILF